MIHMLLSTWRPDFDVKGPLTFVRGSSKIFIQKDRSWGRQILFKQTMLLILSTLIKWQLFLWNGSNFKCLKIETCTKCLISIRKQNNYSNENLNRFQCFPITCKRKIQYGGKENSFLDKLFFLHFKHLNMFHFGQLMLFETDYPCVLIEM